MKKKSSIALSGILAASMLFTGCGGNSESKEATGGSAEDGYTVATVRWADWGEDYHTGFPDQAAEEAGIDITWNTILNSDWGDKKAVLLAGGNLPDAFMGSICFTETDILTNTGTFIPEFLRRLHRVPPNKNLVIKL